MAFLPVNYEEGNIVELPVAATTFVKGDACVFASGYMTTAANDGTVPIFYICMEDVSTTATEGDLHRFYRTLNVPIFECDTTGTPTQAQMGTYMDITGKSALNEDATDDDLFFAERLISGTNKKVQGWWKSFAAEA